MKEKLEEKIWNKNFCMMFITAFLLYMSMNMTSPTIPKFVNTLGASETIIGVVGGMFALVALLVRPVSGQAVDIQNKKKILMGTCIIVTFAIVGYSISNEVWMIILFRAIHGFGWGFGSTVCMTIACDSLPISKLNMGIGIYGMGQIAAGAIAPSIGLAIADNFGFRAMFLVAASMALLALFLAITINTVESKNKGKKYSFKVENIIAKEAVLPATVTLVNSMAYASITTFIVIYGEGIGILGMGMFFTIYSITILLARPVVTKLGDKFGNSYIIIPSEILIGISVASIYLCNDLIHFLIVAAVLGIGFSGAQPALMAECVKAVGKDRRGVASSTSYIGTDIGMVLGSNIAGIIASAFGYKTMFLFFAIPIIVVIAIYAKINLKFNKESIELKKI